MPAPESIQQKAERLYRFIRDYLKEHARSPSHREMAKGTRMAPETVYRCLRLLVEQKRAIHRLGRQRQVWLREKAG